MVYDVYYTQRNHSLFGTVKALQKSTLPSNGVHSMLPASVPRLVIPDALSSEQPEGSDEMLPRVPARYQLPSSINVVILFPTTLVVLVEQLVW